MKGLELSEKYYEAFGRDMIAERFPQLSARAAVGLSGQGSDCLGFDDELSRDHDYGPGFCIWLTDEDFDSFGTELQSAYEGLPSEFMGFDRARTPQNSGRVGAMRTSDFYRYFIGCPGIPENLMKWVRIQEHFLATCTSGKVFRDELGEFSGIRNGLLPCYPEDVRKKKLAARVATMAQSGQYNFQRMMKRGDVFGARLALGEFLNAALSMVYLMNRRYEPFYKWQFEGASQLECMADAMPFLKDIAASSTRRDERIFYDIDAVSSIAVRELGRQGLTSAMGDYLEPHAYSIMDTIDDDEIRSLHVMEG